MFKVKNASGSETKRREERRSVRLPDLDCVLSGPLPSGSFVPGAICIVDMCDLWYEWVVGVGVGEHGAYREENCSTDLLAEFRSNGFVGCVPLEIVKAGDH